MQGRLSKRQKPSRGGDERLILQKRDLRLLETLSILRIADRNQTSKIAGFNSTTRVNARLLKLARAGILKRFFFVSNLGGKKAVYSLSKKGADLIGKAANLINRPQDSFLIGDKFVAHQLAINEVYCAAHAGIYIEQMEVKNWRSFKHPFSQATPVIPDAYFEVHLNGMISPIFLEVDRGTEGIPVWNIKVKRYVSLAASGEFERIFDHPRFSVAVVVASKRRMHSLRKYTAKITSKLLYFTTLEEIERRGIFAPIWFRPDGDQLQSLI